MFAPTPPLSLGLVQIAATGNRDNMRRAAPTSNTEHRPNASTVVRQGAHATITNYDPAFTKKIGVAPPRSLRRWSTLTR
jgi:hypothetical protein